MEKRTILQISIEVNYSSVGRIAEQIGIEILNQNWDSYITYARGYNPSKSKVIKIGSLFDVYFHVLMTRIFDKHCFYSKRATIKMLKDIELINPDLIVLHHIHGYFLNMKILFEYLKLKDIPVVWVFHDFWSITGHCAHFTDINCEKWKNHCQKCPKLSSYPKSILFDSSKSNFFIKKELFTSLPKLNIVTVSNWVKGIIEKSFLKEFPIHTIHNGIDLNAFKPNPSYPDCLIPYNISDKKIILGVATAWNKSKGLNQFFELANLLPSNYRVVLVGLKNSQILKLPQNIIGLRKTENINELVKLYTIANIHVSLSIEETFGLTIIESMACGTPVISYSVGALPELITNNTGSLIEANCLEKVVDSIIEICSFEKSKYSTHCRQRVVDNFSSIVVFERYIKLFNSLMKSS